MKSSAFSCSLFLGNIAFDRIAWLMLMTTLAAWGIGSPASAQEPSGRATRPPNIVLILADDMGIADLGCYGSKRIQTPNLNRLAHEGMRFSNAYAGHTVCAASRCVLMTGLHTGHARIRANSRKSLRPEDVTVAELLQQAGYATGGFGKWGLGEMRTTGAAERQGFDTFFGYYHQVHAHSHYPPFLVSDGSPFLLAGNAAIYGLDPASFMNARKWDFKQYKQMSPNGPEVITKTSKGDYQFAPYMIVEQMKRFIADNRDQPFFCYAPWTPPHAKYHIPAEEPAWQLYRNKPWASANRVHASFCTMLDRHVGEILQHLDDLGLSDNTMVIFMSDNGAARRFDGSLNSCGQFRGQKRNLYEGGIRSPLLVKLPGRIKPRTTSRHITYSADILPTLVELAGAGDTIPGNVDGLSLLPTLLGQSGQQTHEYLYWQALNSQRRELQALRSGDLKFVQNSSREWEVYNLARDPRERINLAAQYQDRLKDVERWISENTTPEE